MVAKRKTSFTLSVRGLALLKTLAVQLGLSQSSTVETLIRNAVVDYPTPSAASKKRKA